MAQSNVAAAPRLAGSTQGLRGDYYSIRDLMAHDYDVPSPEAVFAPSRRPAFSRVDPGASGQTAFHLSWEPGEKPDPAQPVGPDHYAVRWTGTIQIPRDGRYVFAIRGDDGARLSIGNTQNCINKWGNFGYVDETSPALSLKKGACPIQLDLLQMGGGASIELLWQQEGQSNGLQPILLTTLSPAETEEEQRQRANTFTYGQLCALQNGYANFSGGYLDVCGRGCEGNFLCVSTATTSNRDGGSGTWQILSATGKALNEPVRYHDTIHLLNQWSGNGGYLDVCGRGCEGNFLCVSTSTGNKRDGGSGTWQILSTTGKPAGTPVLASDTVYLLNQWSGNGGYLDVCGRGCEGNVLCVSTATSNNRDSGSGTWRISRK